MRKLRIGPTLGAAGMVALVLAAAACSSSGSSSAKSSPASKPASASSSAPARTTAPAGFSGIVIGSVRDGNVQVGALNPKTGSEQIRIFNGSGVTLAYDPSAFPGFVLRQALNSNFTEMAATGPAQSNGATNAGYVNLGGNFVPVTASAGGYSTVQQKQAVGFNPATGILWYMVPGSGGSTFGTVNSAVGPASDHAVTSTTPFQVQAQGSSNATAFFAPNGYGPLDATSLIGGGMYLPGGVQLGWDSDNNAFQFGPNGPNVLNTRDVQMQPVITSPHPELGLSSTQFLETDGAGQLYLCTLSGGVVHTRAMLPQSNMLVGDAAVSPNGKTVAFLATSGSVTTLYTTPLTADGQQPTQVVVWTSGSFNLLGWNN